MNLPGISGAGTIHVTGQKATRAHVVQVWYLPAVRSAVALAAVLASLVLADEARAYEDKLTFGVEGGYGLVAIPSSLPEHGVLLGISSSIGLNDIWSVRAHLDYGYHPAGEPLHVLVLGAEILYLLDVVQFVPYFGLGIDGLGTYYEDRAGLELGAHVVLGIDYLLSRDTLIGFDLRPHVLPLSVNRELLEPVYITATLRFSFVFDL